MTYHDTTLRDLAEEVLNPCAGSCYSEFEEGRPCSRHGRPAPTLTTPESPTPSLSASRNPESRTGRA